jgi:C_GCAxxG_C_C family probable redox protein
MSDRPETKQPGMDRRSALRVMATSAAAFSMPSLLAVPADALLAQAGAGRGDALGRRSFSNALRRGHCAPAILETLLPADRPCEPVLRLAGALPGGIGDSGAECGGVTAATLYLGLSLGGTDPSQIDQVIGIGQRYVERFRERNGSIDCRDIRDDRRGLMPCIRAIVTSPRLLTEAIGEWSRDRGPGAGGARPDAVLARMRPTRSRCAPPVGSCAGRSCWAEPAAR